MKPIENQILSNKRILIVEDNDLNMKLVKRILEISGAQTIEALDGESSIEIAGSHLPDLILMDIQLPGMSGLEATKILKSNTATSHIPVVALTSFAMAGDNQKILEAGCVGHITKPIETRKFIELLKPFLPQSHIAAAPSELPCKTKILIVDDDPLNVKLLAASLKSSSFDTIFAYDGNEALQKTFQESPNLILLDIMMPGLNGYEVTRQLRKEPSTQNIPIILVTALDGPDYKTLGSEAGADDFLNKPVNTSELLKRVNSLLSLKSYQKFFETNLSISKDKNLPKNIKRLMIEDDDFKSILVISEHNLSVDLIRAYLKDRNYYIDREKGLYPAIDKIQKEKIDLLILDNALIGKEIDEFFCQIGKSVMNQNVQILLLIDKFDLEENAQWQESKNDDFLVRPINLHELKSRVRGLLKKKDYLDKIHTDNAADFLAAITDKPSGLFSKFYLNHYLDREIKRALRHNMEFSVALFNFAGCLQHERICKDATKLFDEIVKEIGNLVTHNVRDIDICARLSEKELAVVFSNTSLADSTMPIERITFKIHEQFITKLQKNDNFDISKLCIGIAGFPSQADSAAELFARAKESLKVVDYKVITTLA